MKFGDLKQKGIEVQAQEAVRACEQAEAEQKAELEREEERRKQEEHRLSEELARLRFDRERLVAFSGQVSAFTRQVVEAEEKKSGGGSRLAELYAKVEATLQDTDVRRGLAELGKDIKDARAFVADSDFDEEPDVVAAREAERLVAEMEGKLVELENGEWELHAEIRRAVGFDPELPRESGLTAARDESSRLLEVRIAELDREVQELEWKTPEGKEKAEGQLQELLVAERSTWPEFSERSTWPEFSEARYRPQDIVRRMLGEQNEGLVSVDALRFKEVLGEEKFMEVVRRNYGVTMDALGEKYKRAVVGREGYVEQKTLEEYPERVKEVRMAVTEVFKERNKAAKSLGEFFKSEEGREALLGVMSVDETLMIIASWRGWLERNSGARADERIDAQRLHESQNSEALAMLGKEVGEDAEKRNAYAKAAAEQVISALDAVAKRFVFNEGWKDSKGLFGDVSLPGKFSEALNSVDATVKAARGDGYYEKLPDVSVVEAGIAEAGDFYRKIQELAKQPQVLKEIYAVSRMIVAYNGDANYRNSFVVPRKVAGHRRDGGDGNHYLVGADGQEFNGMRFHDVSEEMPWQAIDGKIVPDRVGASTTEAFQRQGIENERLVGAVVDFVPQTQITDKNQNVRTIGGNPEVVDYLRREGVVRGFGGFEGIQRVIESRKRAAQSYDAASGQVARMIGLAGVEVDDAVARMERKAFESSPEFAAARRYEEVQKRKKFARAEASLLKKVETDIAADSESEIVFSTETKRFEDSESERLKNAADASQNKIVEQEKTLEAMDTPPPRGLDVWGRKKEAWKTEKANLRRKLQNLRDEREQATEKWNARKGVRDRLAEADKLLERIAAEFREDFERAGFPKGKTTLGTLAGKLHMVMEDFARATPSEDEIEAVRIAEAIAQKGNQTQEALATKRSPLLSEFGRLRY